MSEHYYSANPTSAHDIREFETELLGNTLIFSTDSGVFSRDAVDSGTRILLEALPPLAGRFLDLACGWGPVGIAVKKKYPALNVVMTDINERAVSLAIKNAKRNSISAEILSGDGFDGVTGLFDSIAVNPPIRAGKQQIYSMFSSSLSHLTSDGALYIVIRRQQGAESAVKYLNGLNAETDVIKKSGGFWVLRARKPVEHFSGDNS